MSANFGLKAFNIDTAKTAGQTQDLTGFGNGATQIKGYFVFTTGQTGTSDTVTEVAASPFIMVGAYDGTNQRVCVGSDSDGAGTSAAAKATRSDSVILSVNPITAAIEGQIAHNAFITDGIQFIYTTAFAAADASHMGAARCHVLAWWGDATAEVGTWTSATATGNQTVNYANGSLNATSILFFSANATVDNSAAATATISIGCADSAGNQGVMGIRMGDGQAAATTNRYGYSGECISLMNAASAVGNRWAIVSMGTSSFTVNKLEGTLAQLIFYVAFAGVTSLVGKTTTVTDTTTVRSIALGKTPRGGIFLSHGTAESTQDTADASAQWSLGAFKWDGTTLTQGSHAARSLDAADPTDDARGLQSDGIQQSLADSTEAFRGLMRVKQVTAAGGGTVELDNNDDADTGNNLVMYLVMGDSASGSVVVGSSTRLRNARRRRRAE